MAKRLGCLDGEAELGRLVRQSSAFRPYQAHPPTEAETNYYAAKKNLKMAA